jgi:hypothetical protein
MASAVALRLVLFRGYFGLDDAEYARLAYQMAEGVFPLGEYPGPAVFPLRIGLIAPTAGAIWLFGLTEKLMVFFPFLLSILILPLAYVFAGTLFGHGAGLISAAVLAVLPFEIENASVLVPDLPGAVLAAAGVITVFLLSRSGIRRQSALFLGGLLAGLLFGFSWLCKETIAYLLPFVLILVFLTVRRGGRSALVVWIGATMGAVGTVLAEMAVYHAVAGDLFFRFHEVERNYAQWENGFFSEGSDWGWEEGESRAAAIVGRVFLTGPRFMLWSAATTYLPLLGLLGAGFGWLKRDRAFIVPSLWLLTLLLMFNFASSSLETYTPLALFHRYLYPLLFPSVVLVGGLIAKQVGPALQSVYRRRVPIGQWSGLLALCVLLWTGLRPLSWTLREPDRAWWTAEVRELSQQIGPEAPLYADTLSLRGLAFFEHYPAENRWTDFQRVNSADDIPAGSLVLLNPRYLDWLERNRGMWLSQSEGYRTHAFFDSLPPRWTEVWENGNASLYRVEEEG